MAEKTKRGVGTVMPRWFDTDAAKFYSALVLAFASVAGLVCVVSLWVESVPAGLFFVFVAIPASTYAGERLVSAASRVQATEFIRW